MSARRHLLILLILTVVIRGLMFISYPMGGQGETQGYHRYAVSQILDGDLLIGNLRHAPGYPLIIAPIAAIGEQFGRFDERVILLFQLTLSSTIPFLLYDILRARHSPGAAFLVALLSLADPFGLQWAHFSLPIWLVALCLVLALWLLHHAERRRSGRLVVLAGFVAGLGVLARWNFAPLAAGLGLLLLLLCSPREVFRRRLRNLALFSVSGALLVLLVFAAVQLPATGVWNISCVSSVNLVENVIKKGLVLDEANGPQTQRFLRLIRLPPLPEHAQPEHALRDGVQRIWSADGYPNWQTAGPWATAAARDAYLSQTAPDTPRANAQISIQNEFVWALFYLGPCESDRLLRGVFMETARQQPLAWLSRTPAAMANLLQPPLIQSGRELDYSLPRADTIEFAGAGVGLGFARAQRQEFLFYNGQWVWRPGIELFSALWAPLNALRLLVFPALVWALFTKRRVYTALAALLLLYITILALIDYPEPRIYAIVYPLAPALAGGLLAAVWERGRAASGRGAGFSG